MGWRTTARLISWRREPAWMRIRHIQHIRHKRKPPAASIYAAGLGVALLLVAIFGIGPAFGAQAAPDWGVPATASCAALAGLDASATNGKAWGHTILPGHGAPGGWFGVDVCDNGLNASAPNGANVSCDRVPDNWAKTGCAPGRATSDGYGLTFQCVELVIRFSAWAYGDRVSAWSGNAPDLWLPQNHPSDFVMYPNGSSHAPVPGDILVWGNVDAHGNPLPAGTDGEHGGHIAVVAAVRNGMVITAEQNVKWGTQDHPSDTLALTQVGSRWILSGSEQRETTLPTYRWVPTMGNTRATYGWLHSIKNQGTFPATKTSARPTPPKTSTTPAKPATPTQMSGGLPSLANAVVVTKDGTLADLVWSQTSPFSSSPTPTSPRAEVRSLGSPPNVRLVAGQTPATVQLADGSRNTYVIGADGHVYLARTASGMLGVWWSDLGMPGTVQLTGSAAASAYAGGLAIMASGSDGNLWWRAGPPSAPGGWQIVGHPDTTTLAGSFAVAGAPGNGAPLLLALGADGRLYERLWQPAMLNGDGSVQAPATWSAWITVHAQPADVQLTGRLVVVPEAANPSERVGSWPDTPLDVLMSDSTGKVWWLRSTSFSTGWALNIVPVAAPVSTLIAGVVVPAQPAQTTTASTSTSSAARATPVSTSSAATSSSTLEIALYAMTAKAPYEAQLAIPAHPHDLIAAPTWLRLAPLPAHMTSGVLGTPLALGSGMSSLLIPQASGVLAGGDTSSTSMLLSYDSSTLSSSSTATNAWVALGSVATAAAFSDPLDTTSLNPQWVEIGEDATVSDSATGLRMVPGSGGAAALLQGALASDNAIAVRVSLPDSTTDASAGLMLYLDGGDWLTFAVSKGNTLAFCVESQSKALPCVSHAATLPKSAHIVWLRVARQATTFTAAYSADAQTWVDVGQWVAGTSSDRSAVSGTTATATPRAPAPTVTITASPTVTGTPAAAQTDSGAAPLGFSEWGVFVTAGPDTVDVPVFEYFDVTATPVNP